MIFLFHFKLLCFLLSLYSQTFFETVSQPLVVMPAQAGIQVFRLDPPPSRRMTEEEYHTDLLGSPIAASNEQGNLLWQQDYKPYGERQTKDNTNNHQWYTGKTEDKETGFIYLNARHYDPEMARFISPDPVYFTEQNTQSFNRYMYANNNPYLYKDPDGKAAETVFDAISLGLSIQQFARNPSWGNFGAMMFDGAATAIPFVPGGMGVAKRAMSSSAIGKTHLPEKLYHYTHADPTKIQLNGLKPGSSGKVFTTSEGSLSPLQAQLDLALPPNRGLPNHLIEINVKTLQGMGINIPRGTQVGRSFNMPGGGTEHIFSHSLPSKAMKIIR